MSLKKDEKEMNKRTQTDCIMLAIIDKDKDGAVHEVGVSVGAEADDADTVGTQTRRAKKAERNCRLDAHQKPHTAHRL